MITIKKQYNTVVSQVKKGVTGFANAYAKFIEKVTINGIYTRNKNLPLFFDFNFLLTLVGFLHPRFLQS